MIRLLLLTVGLVFSMSVVAQNDTVPATQIADTNIYRIVKTDGEDIVARILKQDEREVLVQTLNGRKFYIPQYEIKEIVAIKYGEIDKEGTFLGEDRFATRYFITTNGLPIKKGEHYVQWNLFGPDFQFGVGKNFGVGIMTTWLAVPIVGSAKYSFKLGEKVQGGVGTLLGTSSWALLTGVEANFGMALPFGTLSTGTRRSNFAVSGGYGAIWQGGDSQGRAILSVAGMTRVGRKISLIFDSFIMPPSDNGPGLAIIIPGMRWHQSEGKAFQFGFTGIVYNSELAPIPVPMVQWYRSL